MVVAKTQKMFDHLKSQFKNRLVQKSYIALVHGVFEKNNVVLDFDIAMGTDGKMAARPKVDEVNLKNVTSLQSGKKAHTDVHVLERFVRHTLVEAKPKTGRTHQIRVHLYAFNHPIVGDPVYLNKKVQHKKDKELQRLFLHSRTLAFTDVAGEVVSFEADIPQELTDFLESLT